MVSDGFVDGDEEMRWYRSCAIASVSLFSSFVGSRSAAQNAPPPQAFQVLPQVPAGPRITPYLQYQMDIAWREDEAQQREWDAIRTEQDLLNVQEKLRASLLQMIGGLPEQKTDLHARITGKIQAGGFSIEKLFFESLPGVYVTALVYVPNDQSSRHPAILVPAGHATNGKIHYQTLCERLANRGYLVIAWDPIGQGERSQFWDRQSHKSRYNLVCGEHAVLGNLAYLAGANLARWEVWDGIRAVDYLLTRSDVDPDRISITGTSGGGTQTALIAALDPRIKVVIPSCYITSLPMRMANRIFADPDSDPEQDLFGMLSNHVGHTGLLLLLYPRPVMVASAVLDFFPIEGARKTFREIQRVYERLDHADRIEMTQGYHTHQFSDQNQEAALDFLDRFNGMPLRHGLAAPSPFPDNDLLCTHSGQILVDLPDARPLPEVIRDFYIEKKSSSSVALRDVYQQGAPANILQWSVGEFHGAPLSASEISWQFLGSATLADNISVDKYLLHHSRFLEMPLLYIHDSTKAPGSAVLWFKDTGKASATDWPEIQQLLASGHSVVTFDFRGLGETRMNYNAVSPDVPSQKTADFAAAYMDPLCSVFADYVYNSLLTGRPYFFQMIDDAAVASRFAAAELNLKVDFVTAPNKAYTTAAAIARIFPSLQLLPQPDSAVIDWSALLDQRKEAWPIQFLVPGAAYFQR